jgi:hypothetical protein
MEPNEDLTQLLGFQLDLLRLVTASHASGRGNQEAPETEELERMLEQVPTRRQ